MTLATENILRTGILSPGKSVVIMFGEMESSVYPWQSACQRTGASLVIVPPPDHDSSWADAIITALDALPPGSLAAIVLTCVHWCSGLTVDALRESQSLPVAQLTVSLSFTQVSQIIFDLPLPHSLQKTQMPIVHTSSLMALSRSASSPSLSNRSVPTSLPVRFTNGFSLLTVAVCSISILHITTPGNHSINTTALVSGMRSLSGWRSVACTAPSLPPLQSIPSPSSGEQDASQPVGERILSSSLCSPQPWTSSHTPSPVLLPSFQECGP
jgi:hypothetical protein